LYPVLVLKHHTKMTRIPGSRYCNPYPTVMPTMRLVCMGNSYKTPCFFKSPDFVQ